MTEKKKVHYVLKIGNKVDEGDKEAITGKIADLEKEEGGK